MTAALPPIAAPLIAGIELGGTKGVAVIAREGRILARSRHPTEAPDKTLGALADDIVAWTGEHGPISALGIASFGPIGLDPGRSDHGSITRTAKPGWSGARVLEAFSRRFEVPIGWDTDVAGAALAETLWGAGQGQAVVVYLTIGTGIGGGLVVDGRPVHGLVHPEMGHVRARRAPGDAFAGICPFHGDCAEGLASGPAIAARAGAPAETLGEDHWVWPRVAADLAELVYGLIVTLSPNRILIGGGVPTGKAFLFPMIRAEVERRLGGYVAGLTAPALAAIVRPPALGDLAGPMGAIALGLEAMRKTSPAGMGLEAGT